MKNRKKTIVALILCGIMLFSLCACGAKAEITKAEFEAKAKEFGLEINPSPESDIGATEFSQVGKAAGDTIAWEAWFYVFSSRDLARATYDVNLDDLKIGVGTESSVTTPNTASYERTADGIYTYMSQVGKTIFFARVDSQYKSEIKEFVKSLGY